MIYKNFLNFRRQRYDNKLFVLRTRGVNFTIQSLDAGDGDVHECIPISAGHIVLYAWIEVDAVCPDNSTVDLGTGTSPNYWGSGLYLDATGHAASVLTSLDNVYPPDVIKAGEEYATQVDIVGASHGDMVTVSSTTNVDTADVRFSGEVIRPNVVGISIQNTTNGGLSLPDLALATSINKAPKANTPYVFSANDTIDIKATTDDQDVNITSGNITVSALVLKL